MTSDRDALALQLSNPAQALCTTPELELCLQLRWLALMPKTRSHCWFHWGTRNSRTTQCSAPPVRLIFVRHGRNWVSIAQSHGNCREVSLQATTQPCNKDSFWAQACSFAEGGHFNQQTSKLTSYIAEQANFKLENGVRKPPYITRCDANKKQYINPNLFILLWKLYRHNAP